MWHFINKILLYYNKIYNFLQIIVMIIINYYYIMFKSLSYFARANAVSKSYKYSRAQTCRLTAFCIKLTYIAILRYRRTADEVAVEICAFVL